MSMRIMNEIEKKALEYLIKYKGYNRGDIQFRSKESPDFITLSDNRGYEIKRKYGKYIYFTRNQLEVLKILKNTEILVFEDGNNIPVSMFSSYEISEGKIIDNIKIMLYREPLKHKKIKDGDYKIKQARKYGFTITVPLTEFLEEGEQYKIKREGNKLIITEVDVKSK